MAELQKPSAVAILETPTSYVLEQRPEGDYPHAGETQLFGGGVEPRETAEHALMRELGEELDFVPKTVKLLWDGIYKNSRDREGNVVPRHVTLFHATVASVAELTLAPKLRDGGTTIVEIGKTAIAIEAARTELKLTDFARMVLSKAVKGESWR